MVPMRPQKKLVMVTQPRDWGMGLKFGFGASYIVNDFINIGLDFDYFNSTIYKYRDSSYRQTNIVNGPNNTDEYFYSERNTIAYKATLLSLTPNITFKAISGPKWFLYNKLGAVIYVQTEQFAGRCYRYKNVGRLAGVFTRIAPAGLLKSMNGESETRHLD